MATRKLLRHKITGAIFGWNPAMAKNPAVEEFEMDLSEPKSKPDSKPVKEAPSKKAAPTKKAAKTPTTPLVADSEEELDALLEGLSGDGKDG